MEISEPEFTSEATFDPVSETPPRRSRPWRQIVFLLLCGLGIVYWLFSRTNIAEVGRVLRSADYFWLSLGVAGNLLTPLLQAKRFRTLYEIVGRRRVVAGCLAQYGVIKSILPIGAGDYVVLRMLKKRGAIASIAEAVPRWIVLRLNDKAAVFAILALTSFWITLDPKFDKYVSFARWGAALVCVAIGFAMYMARKMPPPNAATKPGVAGQMLALRRGLVGLHRPGTLAFTIAWSLMLWAWQASCLVFELRSFPLELSYLQLWSIATVLLAVTILPINAPLGIGTHHAMQVGILTAYGIPAALALATAIGVHAAIMLTIFLQAALGSLLLAWSNRSSGRASVVKDPLSTPISR